MLETWVTNLYRPPVSGRTGKARISVGNAAFAVIGIHILLQENVASRIFSLGILIISGVFTFLLLALIIHRENLDVFLRLIKLR